jgi:hypothetical protein
VIAGSRLARASATLPIEASHDRRMRAPLRFSEHARDKLLASVLDVTDIEDALESGETIEEYEDGARLVLGRARL